MQRSHRAASSRLCIRDAIERMSSASSLLIPHVIRAFVCSRISEHPEDSLHEIGKAALFASLALTNQIIDGYSGHRAAECSVNQLRAIFAQARLQAKLVSNAFRGLQYSVKIVVGNKFRATKTQYIGMHSTSSQISP